MMLRVVGGAAVAVLAADVVHAHRALSRHNADIEAAATSEEAASTVSNAYPDCPTANDLVDRSQFDRRLEELQLEVAGSDPRLGVSSSLDSISFVVNRESGIFLAGGRAALLQVAHPYVAAGVAAHSKMFERGVQERFYRTRVLEHCSSLATRLVLTDGSLMRVRLQLFVRVRIDLR